MGFLVVVGSGLRVGVVRYETTVVVKQDVHGAGYLRSILFFFHGLVIGPALI